MHRKSSKHDLQADLHHLVDAVAPRVESAVTTVAERTPQLMDRGREAAENAVGRGRVLATEKGTLLAERLPDSFVDRLPDSVVDQLPVRRRGRGKKVLLLVVLGGLAAAGVAAARKSGKPAHATSGTTYPPPPTTSAGPVSTGPTPVSEESVQKKADPSDPLTEPHVNGRIN